MKKKSIIKCVLPAFLLMAFSTLCKAQGAAGCFTSKGLFVGCYESWTDEHDGVSYRCYCNCAKTPPAECTPIQNSTSGNRPSSTINSQKPDTENTPDPEIERQANEKEKADLEKQQAFERGKLELSGGLKRNTSTAAPALKTGTTSLPLKTGNSIPVEIAVPAPKEKAAEKIIPIDKNEERKQSLELIELARQVQDEAIKLNLEADK